MRTANAVMFVSHVLNMRRLAHGRIPA